VIPHSSCSASWRILPLVEGHRRAAAALRRVGTGAGKLNVLPAAVRLARLQGVERR